MNLQNLNWKIEVLTNHVRFIYKELVVFCVFGGDVQVTALGEDVSSGLTNEEFRYFKDQSYIAVNAQACVDNAKMRNLMKDAVK